MRIITVPAYRHEVHCQCGTHYVGELKDMVQGMGRVYTVCPICTRLNEKEGASEELKRAVVREYKPDIS